MSGEIRVGHAVFYLSYLQSICTRFFTEPNGVGNQMSLRKHKVIQVLMVLVAIVIAILAFEIHRDKAPDNNSVSSKSQPFKNKFNINYIDDSENKLSLPQVSKLPSGMYADSNKEIHSPDSLVFSVWYKVTLKPNEDVLSQPFNVTVDNPTLDKITFYLMSKDKVIHTKKVGDTVYSKNNFVYVIPQININHGMHHNQSLYIHIETNGASGSPIVIEPVDKSQLRSSAQLMLIGGFIGVVLIMIIYNFIMFRGIGDPSYFNYIGYIIFGGLAIVLINGFAFYVFPFTVAKWLNQHLMLTHFSGLTFALTFAISFLRFDKIKPWFVNLGMVASKVILVFALSGLYFTEATLTPFYFAAVLFVYVYVLSLMAMVINARLMWVRYYLLSWLPLFLGVGIGIATFNGGVSYSFLTRNAALLGVLAEISIMAIALMDRFHANEIDKEYRINHDSVTRLPNKTALESALQKLINDKKSFTLVLFEIPEANTLIPSLGKDISDEFFIQLFNNVEGYADGLTSVYEFENNLENETFHVARVGESCFSLVFVGDLSDEALSDNFLAIQEAVSTFISVNRAAISVSCYAGVVSYPNDTTDKENIITLAFQALLGSTQNKHDWTRYEQQKSENIKKRFELAAELQTAIDSDDLELFHQPQINMETGEVSGSELLLRWNHNELGYISPRRIISIAEETGTINHLTEWVITQGLNQHAKLYKLGFEHTVSINISSKDLTDNGLIAHILTIITESLVPPASVIFELTESATLEEPEAAKTVITELHQQGFKIAIDNFGTGYSSLDYLSQLPFYQLKIDKRFMNIDKSPSNRTITEMAMMLGNRLGVSVVAEGVETQGTADILKTLSCPLAQGYLYAKPMAFIDYMRWLQKKP
ncbi:EAL domain-containing protein [uncultured Psychrosphaera sp.]|uniref:EAL domain-containing protein n=1 Tax=uncultured Psychrosphaera sp. TaxID=1403522 RepID=UPI00261763EA|nr:EAL domain-containing protein [uncultured Psychrosphaera sp.]